MNYFRSYMDCLRLSETSSFFGFNGFCISTEKSHLLQNSLLILQEENHFRKMYYWGRINGIQNDYHVAFGYEKDCLNGQTYFYSLDCLEWLLMPKPDKCGRFLASLAVTAFEGDPAIVTNVHNSNPAFPPNEDSSKLFKVKHPRHDGPIPEELKEEDRLASIIELINEDALIVPRGAWYKRTNGEIVENLAFEGLTNAEAVNEKSYLHARAPQQKWNTNLLTRPDYNYGIDFLDSIDTDVPRGCWNLQIHQSGRLANLQSLYWPGMTFYHKVNSPHYGSMYVGHGMKNLDVPFMI